MSGAERVSRRGALAILGVITLVGAAGLVPNTTMMAIPDRGMLFALFPDLRHAGSLCQECLRRFSLTAPVDRLYPEIVPAEYSDVENTMTIADLRHAIRQQIRKDFDVGDTVSLDGWMLSITELRIYAYAALISP